MSALTYATARRSEGARCGYEGRGLKRESTIWRKRMAAWAEQTDRAYMLALRTTGSPALAEEAVQEACVRILQNPPEDRGDDAAAAYFLKAVHGVAANMLRSSKHRRQREEIHGVPTEKTHRSPDEIAAAAEIAKAAQAALEGLPQDERVAICLCCEQNLTRGMAAYVLQAPEQTVADRVQRGLEKLRRRLVAQGFAAAAPVVLGQQLAELGVPKAPAGLVGRVRELGASARESVRAVRNAAGRKASGNVAVKVVLGVALAGAIGVVASGILEKDAPPPAQKGAEAEVPAAYTAQPAKPLHMQWSFDKGPAKDLEVLNGTWSWSRPEGEEGGCMSTANNQSTLVQLPIAIPERPVRVSVKLRYRRALTSPRWIGVHWCQGGKSLKHENAWKATGNRGGEPLGTFTFEQYFIGRYTIQVFGGAETIVNQYERPHPGDRLAVAVTNFDVLEIELQELSETEMPDGYADPQALLRRLNKR